jgi:hypothetical protein
MAKPVYVIDAEWDDEAEVWVATSEDIPGLVTEADTLEELASRLRAVVPELLRANGVVLGDGVDEIPISLLARRHDKIRLLA